MKKPPKLQKGDKVATISLSWGGAGDLIERYNLGKQRLIDFGLEVVEMENTLKGSKFIYEHPQKRAEDFMNAFKDPSIKGIFACIGGTDSIRLIPYIDFDVIAKNPKVFIGYSDTTVSHFMCYKAGLTSFYGPSVLSDFAENVQMFDYTKHWFEKAVFCSEPMGEITASPISTSEFLPWEVPENAKISRKTTENQGYELLQGNGVVQGHLLGGCIEVLENLRGTELWPKLESWKGAILFIEPSERRTHPLYIECWIRGLGAMGILQSINGIIFGKPYENKYYDEYKNVLLKIVKTELNLDIPILYNMNFGHTAPITTLPYGVKAEINCDKVNFSIVESAVI
ncbi:peptidase S66 [Candidatus Epulonipiscium fishelsonii]|uniref:Peptidase S66 n=1 Tax=Candidatus Epulonipiscium fishelsonii TaxID=77094 RepID=A0ACC8XHX5_9FIRM|nr:peptidase S66 [Epulopiscium sp. SCG-D08WGA-EpuloA1]